MKIIFDASASAIDIDEPGYCAFLRDELGLTAEQIEGLTICVGLFQVAGETRLFGWYDPKQVTISFSMLHACCLAHLNRTLLHETRHFQMHMIHGDSYEPYEAEDYVHADRISEKDAEVFAEWFADRAFLVALTNEPLSRPSLSDWWR